MNYSKFLLLQELATIHELMIIAGHENSQNTNPSCLSENAKNKKNTFPLIMHQKTCDRTSGIFMP